MKKSFLSFVYSSLFLSSFLMSSHAHSSTTECLNWYDGIDQSLAKKNYSGAQTSGYDVVTSSYLRNFEYLCGEASVSKEAHNIFNKINFSKNGWENEKINNDSITNHIQNLTNKISIAKSVAKKEAADKKIVDERIRSNAGLVATCLEAGEAKRVESCKDINRKQVDDYNEFARTTGLPATNFKSIEAFQAQPATASDSTADVAEATSNSEERTKKVAACSKDSNNCKGVSQKELAAYRASRQPSGNEAPAANKGVVGSDNSGAKETTAIIADGSGGSVEVTRDVSGKVATEDDDELDPQLNANSSLDDVAKKLAEEAEGVGGAYDIVGGQKVDSEEHYNVGTVEAPIMIPGSAINDINAEINGCIKDKTSTSTPANEKQEIQNVCKDEAIASCRKEGGYCKTMQANMTAGDENQESVEEKVHGLTADEIANLSNIIDVDKVKCLDRFSDRTSNHSEHVFIDAHVDLPFLNDSLKINEQGNISNDIPSGSGMYLTENSCQTILGGTQSFTESKLEIRNEKQFCKDTLQAAFHRNIEKSDSACYKAMEALQQKVSGTSCIRNVGQNQSATQDMSITDICKEKHLSKTSSELSEGAGQVQVALFNSCVAEMGRSQDRELGKKMLKPECTTAYEKVKSCLQESADQNERVAKLKLVSGCVSLAQAAADLRSNHLDAGEEDEGYQSVDSQIRCVVKAPDSRIYAMDYLSCRNSAQWYNGAFVATDMLNPVLSNAYEAYKSSDIQADQMVNNAKGGVDAQTAAFNAQKRQYNMKANSESTKGVMQGAKAMAMFGNMMRYATPSIISDEYCNEGSADSNLSNIHFCNISYMAEKNSNIKKNLFPNQNMKRVMLNIGFQSLSKAIIHSIVAGTYKKRSKLVGDVENALKEADFNQPENQIDIGLSFCQQNPQAVSCRTNGRNLQAVGGVDFSFDGITPQGTSSLDFEEGLAGDGFVSSNNAVKPTDEEYNKLGDLMNPSSDNQLSKDFNKIGAAKVGSGGGGSGGGSAGGGGGGGGAATAPGGGGGAKGGGGNRLAANFGKKGGAKYQSGGGGRIARSGGTARSKKSTKKNPFSTFGKNKASRSIASRVNKQLLPKKSRLFEVISRRYTKVNNSGGLMKVQD